MEYNKITDEELLASIDSKVRNSVGGMTGSSDLSKKRESATYEYTMDPRGDLAPQGVSKIVSSDTVEIIEGYTSLVVKLLLDNNKLANFVPRSSNPRDIHDARVATDVVNYCIFNSNDGWRILNTWIKSAFLYGNGTATWAWVEDAEYEMEEYESIPQVVLDEILSDSNIEIVGDLEIDEDADPLNPEIA